MQEIKTKEDIYQCICSAASLGTLGLFVGSGFTKAILKEKAFNWQELLEKCCEKMDVEKEIMNSYGSYPELASKICKEYAEKNKKEYTEAIKEMKSKICNLTTVFPQEKIREEYSNYFEQLSVGWIVTTNYDTILESVLNGRAMSISPRDFFTKIEGMVPVYHIHGINTKPNSIVIKNEDYACLFRPNDYRQARLPFLIKESLVLMIGYGLGDINVRSAIDWSKNVYTNTSDEYDFPAIQLLYKEGRTQKNPYQIESGVYVVEINDIGTFFKDLQNYSIPYKRERDQYLEKIRNLISDFSIASEETVNAFIENESNYREYVVNFIASLKQEFGYIYISYYHFIQTVLDKMDEMSREYGAFAVYEKKLTIILDILEEVPFNHMPPAFFALMASALNSLVPMLGKYRGQAWDACRTWNNRKENIPEEIVEELKNIAGGNLEDYTYLSGLLKQIKQSPRDKEIEKLT